MLHPSAKALCGLTAFFCLMSSSPALVWAAEARQLSITPMPGKETCASFPASTTSMDPELCVVQGNFSHDVYTLKLDGQTVLKGIDDQTTKGILSTYKNQTVQLCCVPQEIFPKENPEATLKEVQRVLPDASKEEAAKIAELLGPGPMGMEVGRLCSASYAGDTVIKAQVWFK